MLDTITKLGTNGSINLYAMKSSSRAGIEHYPCVDTVTTEGTCTCEIFTMQLAPKAAKLDIPITIAHPKYRCKHIAAATKECLRSGEIQIEGRN